MGILKTLQKCCICDNAQIDGDGKVDGNVRDHCHITGKQSGSRHKNCNIKVKLNNKFFTVHTA